MNVQIAEMISEKHNKQGAEESDRVVIVIVAEIDGRIVMIEAKQNK